MAESRLHGLIKNISTLPFMGMANNLTTYLAKNFEQGATKRETRLSAIATATAMTAGAILGINFAMNRIPVYFVKKFLLPVSEWALKASLAWVIFIALESAAKDPSRDTPPKEVA